MKPIPVVRGTHNMLESLSSTRALLKVYLISGPENWIAFPNRGGYSIFKIQPGWHDYFPNDVEFTRLAFEEHDTAARSTAWRVALILNRQVPITGKQVSHD